DNVGVSQYAIYRDGVEVAATTSTSWTDNKVTAGQTYKYSIVARDAAGNASSKSSEVAATIPGQPPVNTAPSAPGSLHTMKVSDTVVDLMWSASTDDKGVTAYNIFRDGVKIGSTTGTSYLDQTVQASKTYTYAVVAVDAEGLQSEKSNTISVATPATPVSPPTADTWVDSKAYTAGEIVVYNGQQYKARWWIKGERPDASPAWELLSPNTGTAQAWISTKAYVKGDRVLYGGLTYEAKWWTSGEIPGKTASWMQVN
ncbi:MAG: carbohydrate-binding protein, partial [Bacilli bacterium]